VLLLIFVCYELQCGLDRTKKEIASYQREADAQIERISKLESSGADEYDIRKQVWLKQLCITILSPTCVLAQTEVLGESQAMIADSRRRFLDAVENLRSFVVRFHIN
jgi:hypothetical protein